MSPELSAESGRSGIFRNNATMEIQVWLDGRLIGACALGVPREHWQRWLSGIVSSLTAPEIVRVYGAAQIDGSRRG